jgi:cysteine desulfurase/selenocysteine lyase
LPWQRVVKRSGASLKFIKVDTETFLFDHAGKDLINEKTKLVSLVHTSNVIGHVWKEGQLESIIQKAHSVGAKVLLDCAQSIPHQKFDVQKLKPDFVAFSAHKMLGPTGVGVLYIKKDLHDLIEPYQLGGSMVHDASFNESVWIEAPGKFEAGTPPIAQTICFGTAIDFFENNVDFNALQKHEAKLCSGMIDGLDSIKQVSIIGNKEMLKESGHLIAFTVDGIHSHDVAAMLAMENIAVRAGHHCVQPFAKLIGIDSSVRASFYMYNNMEDVNTFIRVLKEIVKGF